MLCTIDTDKFKKRFVVLYDWKCVLMYVVKGVPQGSALPVSVCSSHCKYVFDSEESDIGLRG